MTGSHAQVRIGTCSWKYDSWRGLVYGPGDEADYLRAYARRYDTVEVDQWFWSLHGPGKISLPRPETVAEYGAAVPENFRFSVKIPNSITLTHFYRKRPDEPLLPNDSFLSLELWSRFLDRLAPLGDRLGLLMLQFEYLNRQKMVSQNHFMEQLGEFLVQCGRPAPLAVEIRNPNYLNRPFFDFLKQVRVSPVFLQGYYMPPIQEIVPKFQDNLAGLAVIRLHGPDREGIEERTGGRWDRLIEPRDEELTAVAGIVRGLLRKDINVYLNVNNHYEGSAPLTIERFHTALQQLPD